MGDFLSTGISGLLAFQRALDTTSHNIANVATEGYSRQRTDFVTRTPSGYGNGFVGNGVDVAATQRIYDDLLADQVRVSSSTFSNMDTFATYMGRVNNLFADSTTGLTASLQKFASSIQDLSNNPTSSSARQVLLSQAQSLTNRLKSYDSQLTTLDQQVESQVKSETTTITTLAQGIAQLNDQIASAQARFGSPPNDLLDQRDKLVDQLSTHIDVSTVVQDDGQLNVFAGAGQPLVVGSNASSLTTLVDPYDATRHGIGLQVTGGPVIDITNGVTGGSLGGALDFRAQVLDPTRNALGRISVGLASVVNDQHHEGMDLTGAMGGDFFKVGGVQALANGKNAGSGSLAVTRTDTGALTTSDYLLEKTATGWSLKRDDTGAAVTLGGTGTALDPFTADGLSIVVSGTASTGDRFLIQPTRTATVGLDVLITDPSKIAAAAPIRAAVGPSNNGSGTISAGEVVDATNAQLRTTSTIAFTNPTTYTIDGSGPFTYTAGQPITANGWQVQISGAPATGDTFVVSDNTGGAGDNRNALALASSLSTKALDNGTGSLNDVTTGLVGSIGVKTAQVQSSRDAQGLIKQENVDARDSVSGVNLDEEAANLIRYQQAYQAAAQLISVASTLFDSLLAATRR